ncbi:MAG: CotH kinase family protein [Clostridia bacterium]|nr:CotH kinase family protein [Clostridia bacterium]
MKKIILPIVVLFSIMLLLCACGCGTTEPSTITVEYKASEGGLIVGEAEQSQEVTNGESVTFFEVVATNLEGYRFIGWDDGVTDAKRTDTLSESRVITAQFEKNPIVTVEYEATEGGRIFGITSQTLQAGKTTSTVRALALGDYRFIGWSDGVTTESREDVAEENHTYIALFEKIEYATATYNAGEGGEIIGFDYQELEKGHTTDEVIANPHQGYHFVMWSDGVTTATRSDVLEGDILVEAIFSNRWIVEYKATEGGYIDGASEQTIIWGNTSSSVSAVAKDGYKFVGWDDGTSAEKRNDKIKNHIVYTAIFKKYYVINYTCNEERGTLDGTLIQEVVEGESSQVVTAAPLDGYDFVCWSNGVTSPSVIVESSHALTLTAYFQYKSYGLPVISVDTENGVEISSKTEYFNCTITLNDTELGEHLIEESAQIRGRGNSTWNFENKPYKIKFNQKQELFGFGKSKDWVLLANYGDISLVRNYLAFQTAGNLSELEASPDSQLVEVYVNGTYQGVYLLCEQIEANDYRVEVEKDASKVDTGYLIEMDEWKDGKYVVVNDNLSAKLSDKQREYVIKFPDDEEITEEHLAFIKDYLERAIAAAQGDDYSKVLELIDVKSFAQVYLVSEIYKCPDVDFSSFFMYKDAGGKLVCGPVWDYDMSFGNVAHKGQYPQRHDYLWAKESNPWFNALLGHEEFVALVASELEENEEIFKSTMQACFEYAYENSEAMEKCFEDRKTVTTFFTPGELSKLGTWQEHMDQVNTFFENSLAYVKSIYLK